MGLFSLGTVFTIDVTQTSYLLSLMQSININSRLRLYICANTLVLKRTIMMIVIKT
jgi:hypothetical protein